MAKPLTPWLRLRRLLLVAAILTAVGAAGSAHAVQYTAWVTGYAMFDYIGANYPYEVLQSDFAGHDPGYCPNDPAADWS